MLITELLTLSHTHVIIKANNESSVIMSDISFNFYLREINRLKSVLNYTHVYFLYDTANLINITLLYTNKDFLTVLLADNQNYLDLILCNADDEYPIYRKVETVTTSLQGESGYLLPLSIKSNELLYYANADNEILANNNIKPQVFLLQSKILQTVTESDLTSLFTIYSSPFFFDIYYKDENDNFIKITKSADDRQSFPATDLYIFTKQLFRFMIPYGLRNESLPMIINYAVDNAPQIDALPVSDGLGFLDLGQTIATKSTLDYANFRSATPLITNIEIGSDNADGTFYLEGDKRYINTLGYNSWYEAVFIECDQKNAVFTVAQLATNASLWDIIPVSRGTLEAPTTDIDPMFNLYYQKALTTQGSNRFAPSGYASLNRNNFFDKRTFLFANNLSIFGRLPTLDTLIITSNKSARYNISRTSYKRKRQTGGSGRSLNKPMLLASNDEMTFDIVESNAPTPVKMYNLIGPHGTSIPNYDYVPRYAYSFRRHPTFTVSIGTTQDLTTWTIQGGYTPYKLCNESIISVYRSKDATPPALISLNSSGYVQNWYYRSGFDINNLVSDNFYFKLCNATSTLRCDWDFGDHLDGRNILPPRVLSLDNAWEPWFRDFIPRAEMRQGLQADAVNKFLSFLISGAGANQYPYALCKNCQQSGFNTFIDDFLKIRTNCVQPTFQGNLTDFAVKCSNCTANGSEYTTLLKKVWDNAFNVFNKMIFRKQVNHQIITDTNVLKSYNITLQTFEGSATLSTLMDVQGGADDEEFCFAWQRRFTADLQHGPFIIQVQFEWDTTFNTPTQFTNFTYDGTLYWHSTFQNRKSGTRALIHENHLFTPQRPNVYRGSVLRTNLTSPFVRLAPAPSPIISGDTTFYYDIWTPSTPTHFTFGWWFSNDRSNRQHYYTLQFCMADINENFITTVGLYWAHLVACYWRPVFWDGTTWNKFPRWIQLGQAISDDLDGLLSSSNSDYFAKKAPFMWMYYELMFEFPQKTGGAVYGTPTNWFGLTGTTAQTIVNSFVARLKIIRALNPKTNLSNLTDENRFNPKYTRLTNVLPVDTRLPLLSYNAMRKWVLELWSDTQWDDWEFSWNHTTNITDYRIGNPITYTNYNDTIVSTNQLIITVGASNLEANLDNASSNLQAWNDIVVRTQEAPGIGPIFTTNMSNTTTFVNIWNSPDKKDVLLFVTLIRRYDPTLNTNMLAMLHTAAWLLGFNFGDPAGTSRVLAFLKGSNTVTPQLQITVRDTGTLNSFTIPSMIIDNSSGTLTALFGAKEYLVGNELLAQDEEYIVYNPDHYWYLKSLDKQTKMNLYTLETYDYQAQNQLFWDGRYQTSLDNNTLSLAVYSQNDNANESERDIFVYGSTPLVEALYLTSTDSFDEGYHLGLNRETLGLIEIRNLTWTSGTLPFTGQNCYISSLISFANIPDDYEYYVDIVYAFRKQKNLIIFSDSSYANSQLNICYFNSNSDVNRYFLSDSLKSVTRFYCITDSSPDFKLFVSFV